ncbi:hypothetical protein STAQ_43130 [Allostella sp. ATCC 35155]|nr:hypothetical protein STAQ_43130 [Stella sp. ATCC 35155]
MLAAQDRAADETLQVRTLRQHLAETAKIFGHGIDRPALVCEIEQRARIALGQPGGF